MLDFAANNKRTLEVRLKTGETIHILPPSVKALQTVTVRQKALKGDDLDGMMKIYADLISNNEEGRKFPLSEFQDYTILEVKAFEEAINEFINGVTTQKN